MSPAVAPECVQCKAAPAVAYAFFAELAELARALPWCEPCMDEILPVLLHWGFAVNLLPADKPAALQVCEYGQECPRLCKAGFRACDEHLNELREVYAGKESGASVDPLGSLKWCELHQVCHPFSHSCVQAKAGRETFGRALDDVVMHKGELKFRSTAELEDPEVAR